MMVARRSSGAAGANTEMINRLSAEGSLPDDWREIFERVPRHLFVPDMFWLNEKPVSRADDPDAWTAAAYADAPLITQYDDGTVAPGEPAGNSPTSSLSMPTVVALMFGAATLETGMSVLEIGTGSGWTAALTGERVGPGNVTTIEVDPEVSKRAQQALVQSGFTEVLVVTGDGAEGFPRSVKYDRVIATCGVFHVPQAWIDQTRVGGQLLIPWRAPLMDGLLLRLDVSEDGMAQGGFVDSVSFMALRSQRRTAAEVPMTDGVESQTDLHSGDVFDGAGAHLSAALLIPNADRWTERTATGHISRIDDLSTGSWAWAEFPEDSNGPYQVRQGGPRMLWNEVESAYAWWQEQGSPEYARFGVTVVPGRHLYWLDDPQRIISSAGI